MKRLAFSVLLLGLSVGPTSPMPEMCVGAQLAVVHATARNLQQAPERSTPEGEWCQREETPMPKGGHACTCHQADCTSGDPEKSSAHTDPMCLNYCTIPNCACPQQDCK